MKIPFRLLGQFRQWTLAGTILAGSLLLFGGWWLLRKPHSQSRPAVIAEAPPKHVSEFNLDEVVLCGNTLVNYRTGEILARNWLDGFGDNPPPIVQILPAQKLVLCGQHGTTGAFAFDGKALPPLASEGKPLGPAAFSFEDSKLLFVRQGNLWSAQVDWRNSAVATEKRITDTGAFRDDVFRGDWFWRDRMLLLPIFGRTHHIDLETGAVAQEQTNIGQISRGCSPDRNFTAVAAGIGKFMIVNFAAGQITPVPIRGKLDSFLWLDRSRLAYISGRSEILIYDVLSGKQTTQFSSHIPIERLVSLSPDGTMLLATTPKGPALFELEGRWLRSLDVPFEEFEWLKNEGLIGSCRSTSTSTRGIWKIGKDGLAKQISGQPVDTSLTRANHGPMGSTKGAVLWVSGGDLWRTDEGSSSAIQITRGQHLPAALQTSN